MDDDEFPYGNLQFWFAGDWGREINVVDTEDSIRDEDRGRDPNIGTALIGLVLPVSNVSVSNTGSRYDWQSAQYYKGYWTKNWNNVFGINNGLNPDTNEIINECVLPPITLHGLDQGNSEVRISAFYNAVHYFSARSKYYYKMTHYSDINGNVGVKLELVDEPIPYPVATEHGIFHSQVLHQRIYGDKGRRLAKLLIDANFAGEEIDNAKVEEARHVIQLLIGKFGAKLTSEERTQLGLFFIRRD